MVTVSKQTPERSRRKFSTGFDRFSGLYLGALFIIVFGLWVPSQFLTTSTLHSVAAQQAVTGMIGLAVLIPLAAGLYDLSVGATANVSGIFTIVLMNGSHWAVAPRDHRRDRAGRRDRLHQRVHRGQARRQFVHRDARHGIRPGGASR